MQGNDAGNEATLVLLGITPWLLVEMLCSVMSMVRTLIPGEEVNVLLLLAYLGFFLHTQT